MKDEQLWNLFVRKPLRFGVRVGATGFSPCEERDPPHRFRWGAVKVARDKRGEVAIAFLSVANLVTL